MLAVLGSKGYNKGFLIHVWIDCQSPVIKMYQVLLDRNKGLKNKALTMCSYKSICVLLL